jgi:fibronectin type 3 domain-containing protein
VYIDSNLTAGDLFFYQVTAKTLLGESERSDFQSAEVLADEIPPATPGDLAVIPAEFEPKVTLNWSAPLVDVTGGELTGLASYVILRAKDRATALVPLDTLTADQTEFIDTALEPATVYFYAIRAVDDNNNLSIISQPIGVQTPGVPQVTGLVAQGRIEEIAVGWVPSTAEDLQGYNVYRSTRSDSGYVRLEGNEDSPFTTGRTVYIDSNLTAGDLFFYQVTAKTPLGESERSDFQSAEVLEDDVSPATPGDLVAIADPAGTASITITWVAPVLDRDGSELTGLTSYVVFRSKDTPTPLQPVDTLDVSLTEFVDVDLEIATTYFYAIRAADDNNNESSRSITVSATTAGVAPPSGIVATSDIERISLRWNPSSDEGLIGYNVYRSGRSNGGFIRRQGNETVDFTTGRTTFIDSNLTGGDLFFYKIAIVTEEGEGVLSRFFDAEALPDTRAPAAPTFIDGEPVSENPDQLAITWNEPTTDLSGARLTGVSSYLIYRSLEREGVFELVGTATESAFQDTGLDARTTYFYEIESVDLQGNVSPRSNPTPLTTGGVAVPSNITLTAIATTGTSGSVTISWDTVQGVSVLFYEVQRTTVPGSTDNADYVNILPNSQNTSRVDNGVTQGQTFFYRVRARDTDQRVSEYSIPRSIGVPIN